ncbi:hypothetical protein [Guptibacillus hwajinpoensis]|uniref:hypothetical protein n=1 Tax=Guptibacillus hwajinpoensis TaxID=208199 RepID=UPI00273FB4A8|nr:hypothetical protein [Pseudalkalibacillus hwajinpoensis]WLR61522.1 hypothetical protein LC071_09655 [Pseudalkalibacillus hwajinpoensis]
MDDGVESYEDLNKMREQQIKNVATDHFALNHFHDQLMSQIVHLAVEKVKKRVGATSLSFFIFF